MSNQTLANKKLKYEEIPFKVDYKGITRKENDLVLDKISTSSIILHLINRYLVEILAIIVCLEFVYIIWTKLGL